MARNPIPNPLERRHLVERKLSAEQALRVADAYLAESRVWESMAFLVKAEATDRLAELREAATREGDFFLVQELSRALREPPSNDRWRAVAEAAAASGKDLYVASATRLADRGEA